MSEVKDMMSSIEPVLEAAHSVVNAMKDGERKQIKNLANEVGTMLGKEPKDVLGFVNHFAHQTKIAYVTRGKNGGLIKGVKPVKAPKVSKKTNKADDTTTTTTSTDTSTTA